MTIRHMKKFFEPDSVAVIGASERPLSLGGAVLKNLLDAGFEGLLLPVNPHGGKKILGVKRYADIASLPAAPDLSIICTSPARIPGVVDELGEKGVHAVLIVMGGLSLPTVGIKDFLGNVLSLPNSLLALQLAGGKTLKDMTWDAARAYDMRILGPNCIGTIVPRKQLNASYAHGMVSGGDVAFVGQSAAVALAIVDWAKGRGLGFSHLTTVGDSLDIDIADVVEYLAEDMQTRAILLHIEQLTSGGRLVSALRAAARSKLVIAMKSRRVQQAHPSPIPTAPNLAGDDAVFDAVFRRTGVLRVERSDELYNALETLTRMQRLHGDRLAIISNGPGPAMLATDHLVRHDGSLAAFSDATQEALEECLPHVSAAINPVDISVAANPGQFSRVLQIVSADAGVDAVLVIHVPTLIAPALETAEEIGPCLLGLDKPVLTSWMGHETAQDAREAFDAAGISTYPTVEQAVDAFIHMIKHARNQALMDQVPRPMSGLGERGIDAAAAWALVSQAQHEGRTCLNEDETRQVMALAGIPLHEASRKAIVKLRGLILAMGITRDPVFGPVLYFGSGENPHGAASERQVGLPPLNLNLANRVIESSLAGRALGEYNEQAGSIRESLAEILVRLGQLAAEVSGIAELAIFPLVVNADGVHVLGIRTELGQRCETAIIPYPAELEESTTLPRAGLTVELRPIRGEDAPAHAAFAKRLSPEAIRYRFFGPRSTFTQHQLAQFTQIDYAREMAFIASAHNAAGVPQTLGVVRSWTDPDNLRAEFAILVEDSMRGEGLGSLLMKKMIDYTRRRGTLEIRGTVLPDNSPMLRLAKKLGFSRSYSQEQEAEVVSLRLNEPSDGWQLERIKAEKR
jgi:acyl-CoA synthetase (NDP forming)/RimJ/RimL family protein N-acetyltransferase